MKTFDIVTLTINPSLDKSTQFTGLIAEQKSAVNHHAMMQEVGESMFLKQFHVWEGIPYVFFLLGAHRELS